MQVRVVGNAGDVMPTVDSFRPDVVILDLSFADGNGVSVFEQLQARHSIPVIVSTGSDFSPPQGVVVLRKPFTTDELLRTLRLVLGLGESE
jgi:DNA-binding response OmpR family regulator